MGCLLWWSIKSKIQIYCYYTAAAAAVRTKQAVGGSSFSIPPHLNPARKLPRLRIKFSRKKKSLLYLPPPLPLPNPSSLPSASRGRSGDRCTRPGEWEEVGLASAMVGTRDRGWQLGQQTRGCVRLDSRSRGAGKKMRSTKDSSCAGCLLASRKRARDAKRKPKTGRRAGTTSQGWETVGIIAKPKEHGAKHCAALDGRARARSISSAGHNVAICLPLGVVIPFFFADLTVVRRARALMRRLHNRVTE